MLTQPFQTRSKEREKTSFVLFIPKRIEARWAKHHKLPQQTSYSYTLASVLEREKVSTSEFRKCWTLLNATLSADDLFSLLKDSGFSPRFGEHTGRLTFVRNALQRYNDGKVFVLCGQGYGHMCHIFCFFVVAFFTPL